MLVILPPQLNWSTVEVCSLVICACIPDFRPFLRLFPRVSRLLDLSSGRQSNFTSAQRSSSYQLESRNRSHNKSHNADNFASSKNLATLAIATDNESQVEILQEDDKDVIKVTTSVQINHSDKDKDKDKDLEPSFIFHNV
jgi:hypothetical protein